MQRENCFFHHTFFYVFSRPHVLANKLSIQWVCLDVKEFQIKRSEKDRSISSQITRKAKLHWSPWKLDFCKKPTSQRFTLCKFAGKLQRGSLNPCASQQLSQDGTPEGVGNSTDICVLLSGFVPDKNNRFFSHTCLTDGYRRRESLNV